MVREKSKFMKGTAVFLSTLMVVTMLPGSLFTTKAATGDKTEVYIDSTHQAQLSNNSASLEAYDRDGNKITAANPNGYIIKQNDTSTPVTGSISCIGSNGTINVELDGVNIKSSTSAMEIKPGLTVNLTLTGTNTLQGGDMYAGIEVPAIQNVQAALTITKESTGSLAVTGGASGAGIGGRNGAGFVGTPGTDHCNCGKVDVNGGTITATGGDAAAGIGGGNGGSGGSVTISGGKITATGINGAAGIGGGGSGGGGSVTISGGYVKASDSTGGTAIGAGNFGAAGSVIITGGSVNVSDLSGATDGSNPVYKTMVIAPNNCQANQTVKYSVDNGPVISSYLDEAGKLYLWLPYKSDTQSTNIIFTVTQPWQQKFLASFNVLKDNSANSIAGQVMNTLSLQTLDNIKSVVAGQSLKILTLIDPGSTGEEQLNWAVEGGTSPQTKFVNTLAAKQNTLNVGEDETAKTVTVTAAATDGGLAQGSFKVDIIPRVTGLTVSAPDNPDSIGGGKTLQFTAAVSPSGATQKVAWSLSGNTDNFTTINKDTGYLDTSSDEAGNLLITATATDGTDKTATYNLSVVPVATDLSISAKNSAPLIVHKNSTLRLQATVTPEKATRGVAWSISSGGNFATIDPDTGVLTGTAPGICTVKATAKDAFGAFQAANVTVIDNPAVNVTSDDGDTSQIVSAVHFNVSSTGYNTVVTAKRNGTSISMPADGKLTVYQNGIYEFTATDSLNVTDAKTVDIENIDETTPNTPVITNAAEYTDTKWFKVQTVEAMFTKTLGAAEKLQYQVDDTGWTDGCKAEVTQDGKHTVYFRVLDTLGRAGTAASVPVNIDTAAPDATIHVAENQFKSLLNNITFGLLFKQTLDITITAPDAGLGLKSVEYQKVAKEADYQPDGPWITGSSLSVSKSEKFILYARVTDNLGNSKVISTTGIIDDLDAPELTLDYPQGWQSSDVTIKVKASDGLSGLKQVTYTKTNDVTPYTLDLVNGEGSLTVTTENYSAYTFTAVDNAGNTTTKTADVYIDKATPQIAISSNHYDDGWTSQEVIYLTYTNNISGNTFSVKIDNDNAIPLTNPNSYAFPRNGHYEFIETAGNGLSSSVSADIRHIDNTPPNQPTIDDADSYTNKWFIETKTVKASFTPTDGCKEHLQYCVNNGGWTDGDSVTVSQQGGTAVQFRVINEMGMFSSPSNSVQVLIDTTEPTLQVFESTAQWMDSGDLTLRFIVSVGPSGGEVFVTVADGDGAPQSVDLSQGYTVRHNGVYHIAYASNNGETASVDYTVTNIDSTPPNPVSIADADKFTDSIWYHQAPTVTASFEKTPGCDEHIQYSLDELQWKDGDSFTPASEGSYTVYFRVIDEMYRYSAEKQVTVQYDKTLPEISFFKRDNPVTRLLNFLFYNSATTYVLAADDNVSGISSLKYQLVPDGSTSDESKWIVADPEDITSIKVPEGFKGSIFAQACDKAQNAAVNTSSEEFVTDGTAPTISAGYSYSGTKTYDKNAAVHVDVEDSCAGLSSVSYTVAGGPEQTDDLAGNAKSLVTSHKFDIGNLPDGDYNIIINAKDNSGNAAVTATIPVKKSTISSVSIQDAPQQAEQGSSYTLSSLVQGTNDPDTPVTWSLAGSENSQSAISSAGVLSVGKNEQAQSLSVKAVSNADPEKSATIVIPVKKRVLEGIAICSHPVKATYVLGQSLDLTGASITETFDNATSEIVPVTVSMVDGFSSGTVGNQTITIKVGGFTAKCNVTVISNIVANQNVQVDISGLDLPSNVDSVSLKFENLSQQAEGLQVVQALENSGACTSPGNAVIYGLELVDSSGRKIPFTNNITVRIPIPAGLSGNLHVFWFNPADGSLHDMNAVQQNGYLVFITNHFSDYAIVQLADKNEQGGNPASGNSGNTGNPGNTGNGGNTDNSGKPVQNPQTGSRNAPFIPAMPLALFGTSSVIGLIVIRRKRRFMIKKNRHTV